MLVRQIGAATRRVIEHRLLQRVRSVHLVRSFPALIVDMGTELPYGLRARPPISAWRQRYTPNFG
jgi:hypothetical protein